jgi:cell division transport system permease protein
MRAWLRDHARGLGASIRRLAGAPLATALNLVAIGVALALPLGAWVVLENVQRVAGGLASDPQLSVFLAKDATRADAARIESLLTGASGARGHRFVPKDQALAELQRVQGLSEIAGAVGTNPLPDAFVVDLKAGDPAATERLAAELRKTPKVALVQFDAAWVRRLDAGLRLGRAALLLLAVLLGVGMIPITFNTIRQQLLTQREEIEVSRLIGATAAYIRRPLVYQGAVLGLAGGLVALGIVAAGLAGIRDEVGELAASYGSDFAVTLPPVGDLAALLAFAALLGAAGAHLSVSRYLVATNPL